jgi:hypothetical protein
MDEGEVKVGTPEEALLEQSIRATENRILQTRLSLEVDEKVLEFLKSKV